MVSLKIDNKEKRFFCYKKTSSKNDYLYQFDLSLFEPEPQSEKSQNRNRLPIFRFRNPVFNQVRQIFSL